MTDQLFPWELASSRVYTSEEKQQFLINKFKQSRIKSQDEPLDQKNPNKQTLVKPVKVDLYTTVKNFGIITKNVENNNELSPVVNTRNLFLSINADNHLKFFNWNINNLFVGEPLKKIYTEQYIKKVAATKYKEYFPNYSTNVDETDQDYIASKAKVGNYRVDVIRKWLTICYKQFRILGYDYYGVNIDAKKFYYIRRKDHNDHCYKGEKENECKTFPWPKIIQVVPQRQTESYNDNGYPYNDYKIEEYQKPIFHMGKINPVLSLTRTTDPYSFGYLVADVVIEQYDNKIRNLFSLYNNKLEALVTDNGYTRGFSQIFRSVNDKRYFEPNDVDPDQENASNVSQLNSSSQPPPPQEIITAPDNGDLEVGGARDKNKSRRRRSSGRKRRQHLQRFKRSRRRRSVYKK